MIKFKWKILFLVLILTIFYVSVTYAENYKTDADSKTLYDYEEELMDPTPSTFSSGRVWTDKTVYSNQESHIEIDNHTFENQDDFMEVFSALGSNSGIGETKSSPIDLVLVIDCTTSMGLDISDPDNEESGTETILIDKTAEATNQLIDLTMNQNPNNQIAIVIFKDKAQTVMPLGRYTRLDGQDYLSVTHLDEENENQFNYSVTFTAQGDVKQINQTVTVEGDDDGTCLQDALREGLKVFADNKNASESPNHPKMITLTDGVPNVCYLDDWTNFNYKQYTLMSEPEEWETMLLQTLLSSAYLRAAVNKNYETPLESILLKIQDDPHQSSPLEQTILSGLLNTNDYLNSSKAENEVLEKTRQFFQDWKAGKDVKIQIDGIEGQDGFLIQKFPVDNEYGVTLEDLLENINYIDCFETVPSEAQAQVFKDLVNSFTYKEFHPIESKNEAATQATNIEADSGYLVYQEPIGEYMEVSLKKMLLFDTEYDLVETSSQTDNSNTIRYFKPNLKTKTGSSVENKAYSSETLADLDNIEIKIETQGYNQTLTIRIPENCLPILNTSVEYNQTYDNHNNRTVESIQDNRDSIYAKPIRFIYGINLNEELKDENGNVKLNLISDEYKSQNLNGDKLQFYTTRFSNNQSAYTSSETIGDAYTTFTPSQENSYYISQDNYLVYEDKQLSNPLRSDEFHEENNYFIQKEYYGYVKEEAKLLKSIEQLNGRSIVNSQLMMQRSEEEPYVNLMPGTNYIGDFHKFSNLKEENKTQTASLAYSPGIDIENNPNIIRTQLGNNGKMALTVSLDININITKYQAIGENSLTKDRLTVSAGDIITYMLEVCNTSAVDVSDILVTDTIPDGLKIVPNSISNNGVFILNNLTWKIDIKAGGTVNVSYQVIVPETTSAQYRNFFRIEYEDNNKTVSKDSNIVVAVQGSPNIELTKYQSVNSAQKTKNKQQVKSRDRVTYYFEAKNNGDAKATNVTITDTIPSELNVDSNSISDNGQFKNNQIIWSLDHLNPGESKLVNFTVIIPDYSMNKNWKNTGYVLHDTEPTPYPSNEVEINRSDPIINITKTQSTSNNSTPTTNPLSVNPGETVTYTLNITNNSNVPATNLIITDQVENDLTIVNGSITNNGTVQNNLITWLAGQLNPGQQLLLSFKVTVPSNQLSKQWENVAVANYSEASTPATSNTVVINENTSSPVSKTNYSTNNDQKLNSSNTVNTVKTTTTKTENNPKTGFSETDINALIWLIGLSCILILTSHAYRSFK